MEELKDKLIKIFEQNIFKDEHDQIFTKLRENEKIEFKKSLHIANESLIKSYLKTICGFANNRGGLIIYGIHPDTFQIVGINGKFEELDNRYASTLINEGVDGSFLFSNFISSFNNILVGFLFIQKAINKPVILKIDFQDGDNLLKNGDIFYRYPGRTRRILADDLRRIIQDEVDSKTKKMLNKINKLVEIGPSDSAVLDKVTGEVFSDNPEVKLIMNQDLLKDLNLIDEGNFNETDGAPAYVIKGTIFSEESTVVEKHVAEGIRESEIFTSFFKNSCPHPQNFLMELVFRTSHYYPTFFFLRQSNLTNEDGISFLQQINEPELKSNTRAKLIRRLQQTEKYKPSGSLVENIESLSLNFEDNIEPQIKTFLKQNDLKGMNRNKSVARTYILNLLGAKEPIPEYFLNNYLKESVEAFSHLDHSFTKTNDNFLREQLAKCYSKLTTAMAAERSIMRKVCCQIDTAIHA